MTGRSLPNFAARMRIILCKSLFSIWYDSAWQTNQQGLPRLSKTSLSGPWPLTDCQLVHQSWAKQIRGSSRRRAFTHRCFGTCAPTTLKSIDDDVRAFPWHLLIYIHWYTHWFIYRKLKTSTSKYDIRMYDVAPHSTLYHVVCGSSSQSSSWFMWLRLMEDLLATLAIFPIDASSGKTLKDDPKV